VPSRKWLRILPAAAAAVFSVFRHSFLMIWVLIIWATVFECLGKSPCEKDVFLSQAASGCVSSLKKKKVLSKPHAGKGEATFQHHHRGQQTLLHEVMQTWGAVRLGLLPVGLYTILPLPILCGICCNDGGSRESITAQKCGR